MKGAESLIWYRDWSAVSGSSSWIMVTEEEFASLKSSLEEALKAKAGAPIEVVRPVVEVPRFDIGKYTEKYPAAVPVQAPAKGQLLWQVDVDDASTAPAVGTAVKAGDTIGYVQTWYGMEPLVSAIDGHLIAVPLAQGAAVAKNEIVALIG